MKSRRLRDLILTNWPAKIISLAAAVLIFVFYRVSTLEERFFNVQLKMDPPAGYAVASPYPKSVRVTLRGKGESIFLVSDDDVEVYADFGKIEAPGEYRIPLRVVRKGAAMSIEPLEVRVDPSEIRVGLEHRLESTVEVKPNLEGNPAYGYELVQYNVVPGTVEITGPESAVRGIQQVQTEAIDLTDRTEDFTAQTGVVLDSPVVHLVGGGAVEVRIIIRQAQIIKTFEGVDIISIDLSPALRLAAPLPEGSIKVQGTQIAIEGLMPGSLHMIVDCSEITRPGQVTLPVQPDVPPDLVVLKYEPQELTLTFLPGVEEESRQ